MSNCAVNGSLTIGLFRIMPEMWTCHLHLLPTGVSSVLRCEKSFCVILASMRQCETWIDCKMSSDIFLAAAVSALACENSSFTWKGGTSSKLPVHCFTKNVALVKVSVNWSCAQLASSWASWCRVVQHWTILDLVNLAHVGDIVCQCVMLSDIGQHWKTLWDMSESHVTSKCTARCGKSIDRQCPVAFGVSSVSTVSTVSRVSNTSQESFKRWQELSSISRVSRARFKSALETLARQAPRWVSHVISKLFHFKRFNCFKCLKSFNSFKS